MSSSQIATTTLWTIPLVLQSVIVVVMFCRKLVGIFPIFFGYTVLVLSREIVLLFLRYSGKSYAFVYWGGEALAIVLGLGVTFEVIRHIFPHRPLLRTLLKSVWILAIVAAVVSFIMMVSTHPSKADRGFELMILLERSARFLQTCVLIAVMALMSRIGLAWHHYSVGIITGLGVYSALDLAALEFRGHLHLVTDVMFILLKPAAYNLACLIWTFYFLRSWRKEPVQHLPQTNLGEWNDVVVAYIDQWRRRF
jgi:hypothetical protein